MNNKVKISPVDMKDRASLGIRAGDTARVWVKIEEKGKVRLQVFEGLVLAVKHGTEPGATFTVRKVASGVGVEKIFPLYSPIIDKIEIVKRAKVRRAKLYFIRDKVAREVKRVLRRSKLMGVATKGLTELEEERKRAEAEESKRQEEEAIREEEATKVATEVADEKESPNTTKEDSDESKDEDQKTDGAIEPLAKKEEVAPETTDEQEPIKNG